MPVPRPAFFISLRLPPSLSTNKIHPNPTAQFDNWQIVELFPTPRLQFTIQHSKFTIKHRNPSFSQGEF
jgi:hypothetical protein